jgi:hypothetical protein
VYHAVPAHSGAPVFKGFQQLDMQTGDPLAKIRTVVCGNGPAEL